MDTNNFIEKLQEALKKVRYENFLTDDSISDINRWLVRTMALSYKGKDRTNPSFYNHFYKTSNDNEIVEIRISNHFAIKSNFVDEQGRPRYSDAVSVIIETSDNHDLYDFNTEYSKYYKEIIYTKDCFDKKNIKKTLLEIIKGLISSLKKWQISYSYTRYNPCV